MSRTFKQFTTAAGALFISILIQVHGAPAGTLNALPTYTGDFLGEARPPAEPLSLWYRRPATNWVSALPVGNGRLGAMVFGDIAGEKLQLNEDTLWAGGPYDPDNTNALAALPEVRRLIFEGKYAEAQKLAGQKMMGKPLKQMPYETIGDLVLEFPTPATVENYRRDLNLDTAVASVSLHQWRREIHTRNFLQPGGPGHRCASHRRPARPNFLHGQHEHATKSNGCS